MILNNEDGTVRAGMGVIAVLLLGFVVWGGLAPLKSAAVAPGRVDVINDKQIVQNLEGGVVKKILIKDGDVVKKGQVLLVIKNASLNAQLDISKNDFLLNSLVKSRLIAQRDDLKEPIFDKSLAKYKGYESLKHAQLSIFKNKMQLRHDEITILNTRITQLNKQINGIRAIVAAKKARAKSVAGEQKEWEKLFKEQLTDKIKLRELDREQMATKGEIASGEADIARLQVQISETKSQIILKERSFKDDTLKELDIVDTKLTDLHNRIEAFSDQLTRAAVKAPVAGTVVDLAVHTVGGVIRPGEHILSVIPQHTKYVVVAKLPINKIDQVLGAGIGTPVDLRFSAFDVQHSHVVEGKLSYVSADSLKDQRGMPYYEIKAVLTKSGAKAFKENGFYMRAGMPCEVMIQTGERTMLSYLLNPFLNMFTKAFNER